MVAIYPIRRKHTAKELAKKFGKSPRTIQRVIAEPREDYLKKANENAIKLLHMKETMSYGEIAKELNTTIDSVKSRLKTARQKYVEGKIELDFEPTIQIRIVKKLESKRK